MELATLLHGIQEEHSLRAYLLRPILRLGAWGYQMIVAARYLGYDLKILSSQKLAAPVLSLGNITTGGTGKTPACIWLARELEKQMPHLKPVILSRGYGKDEAILFEEEIPQVPHIINRKRYEGGQEAIEKYGKKLFFILDDGFQHRQLQRQIEIVLIDASCPFGYGYMLPRGFLREPMKNLARADAIILTKTDMVSTTQLKKIKEAIYYFAPKAKISEAVHKAKALRKLQNKKEVVALDFFCKKRATVFCGIGNPKSFLHALKDTRVEIEAQLVFQDHQEYSQKEAQLIEKKVRESQSEILITTAKDAVKLKDYSFSVPLWVLEIEFSVHSCVKDLFSLIQERVSLFD